MKFYTSYFYAVRFFNKNIIPMSTAIWDPKWFHENKSQSHWYVDKRGVVNGFRIEPFMPGPSCANLCRGPESCGGRDPSRCAFLQEYSKQLDSMDFEDIMTRFYAFAQKYKTDFNVDGNVDFALLVHEAPTNPCSERIMIQRWFHKYGINCAEYPVPRKH